MRPLSYVDLLNVPYPQPPPSGAQNLNNPQLRSAVGTNASLLSTRKTLEMYRANAMKTNDLATQYQFAIFMVSAAQEASVEPEELSHSNLSEKSSQGSIQGDLLKEARTILQRLSDRSYPFAQYYLADGFFSGLFNKGKEDYDKAFPLFLAASKHGHAEAGYRTALCYEFGWGCRVD
jgi:TPR repeat protein